MKAIMSFERNGFMKVLSLGVLCAVVILLIAAKPASAPLPMQYQVVTLPTQTLNPLNGEPANAFFTLTSSNGPFCIQGMVMSPGLAAGGGDQIGDMLIHLNYIDGNGLSHPNVKLIDGATGGFSPYDLVISYGTPICAANSVNFQATAWPLNGIKGGVAIEIVGGQAIILTTPGNTITVQ